MAQSDRKYIYRGSDHEEYGPVSQQGLLRLVQAGKITAYHQIRSTLIPKWDYAKDVSFLAEPIAAQQPVEERVEKPGWRGIWEQMTYRAPDTRMASGLIEAKAEDYVTAAIAVRTVAAITDLIVLTTFYVSVFLMMTAAHKARVNANFLFYAWFVIVYLGTLWYYAAFACFGKHQTPGQRFWGLLVIKTDGRRLLLGRCFLLALTTIVFGLLTPFVMFITPSGRAPQDFICGIRVVKHRVVPHVK